MAATQDIFTADFKSDPWWWEAAPRPDTTAARPPAKADVVIVGAGFTGLSAALVLARAGREVLVLDAGAPGFGASSRNGGMIGSGHRAGFPTLCERYGEPAARNLINEGLASLDFTVDLIEREQIRCHFKRTGRFRGAWAPQDYEAFGREIDLLRKEFEIEADMVPASESRAQVATAAYHGGCVYHQHGGLHPALLHQGLLERATAAGATVIGQQRVTGLRKHGAAITIATDGATVSARDVIVATNGYTGPATPFFRRRLIPVPSFIIATEDIGEEKVNALIPSGRMIVESRTRHCYYRPSPDGRRILFGGRAALTPTDPRQSGAILYRMMTGLFPDLEGVKGSHSWTGFVAFSRDHLPHVGLRDGIHYALGYSGSGVAMAPYLGHKAAHKVLGDAEGRSPFDGTPFRAYPFYDGRPWFLPLVELWYRHKDRREGSP